MQHPKNRTTLGYVRYHNELFMREAQRQPQQLGFGAGERQEHLGYHDPLAAMHPPRFASPFGPGVGEQQGAPWSDAQGQFAQEQFSFQPGAQQGPDPAAYMSPNPRPFTSTYPADPVPARASPAPAFTTAPAPATQHLPTAANGIGLTASVGEGDARTVVDDGGAGGSGNGNASDYYSPTLSPSAFMLHQYTLPGCDNVYGTCRCGDGCECDGCLTHSGHDGFGPAVSSSDHSATVTTAAGLGETATAAGGVNMKGWGGGLFEERGAPG
jgi:hypothetical protein